MSFIKNLKKTAKDMPIPLWVAGLIIPGGLTAIAIYMMWKAKEKEQNDRSKDSSG